MKTHLVLAALLLAPTLLHAAEYHVSPDGNDRQRGSSFSPFRTIQRAADVAKPGDTVIVHPGIYREHVDPPRGGSSEERRIAYQAAPGGEVVIAGSEVVDAWEKQPDGTWLATIDDKVFGDYNPYALNVKAAWQRYGDWHTRGAVYLDGRALHELRTREEVADRPYSWKSENGDGKTTIHANFGDADPAKSLIEINARETVFFPETPRLSHITVSGFTIRHAALNWSPPGTLQKGAIGPNFGKYWIIENCIVRDARAIGISIGNLPGAGRFPEYGSTGFHIIRNNRISHCGQSGIAGHNGCAGSIIENNVIEETNHLREFGGWETAALKFHHGVDMIIRNNLIRGVYKDGEGGAFGIWIDVGTQGMRVSSNLVLDTQDDALYFEANHGPILIDNNIIIGKGIHQRSQGGIFVHNLLLNASPFFSFEDFENDAGEKTGARVIPIFAPNSTNEVGRLPIKLLNDRWFNNLFLGNGLDRTPDSAEGFLLDHNVFLVGARPSTFADENSLVIGDGASFDIRSDEKGIFLKLRIPAAALKGKHPAITHDFIGELPHVNQGMIDQAGKPIDVDTDYFGLKRDPAKSTAGPFSTLRSGEREVRLWPKEISN